MNRPLTLLAFASICLPAQAQLFDFESSAATFFASGNRPGGYTSLAQTSGGVTLTLTRPGGTAFDVGENSGGQSGKPASWGMHSLDPFFDSGPGFIGDFSSPVSSVSMDFGDYNQDSDTLTLQIFAGAGGTGALLGSSMGSLTTLETFVGSVSATGTNIMSFTLSGSSSDVNFPNSVFIDNIAVQSVPEPASMAALGLGGLAFLRRRKRN